MKNIKIFVLLLYAVFVLIGCTMQKGKSFETKPIKEDVINVLSNSTLSRGNSFSSRRIYDEGEFGKQIKNFEVVITDYLSVSPDGARGYKVEFKATNKSDGYSFMGEILFLKWESGWRAVTDGHIYIR